MTYRLARRQLVGGSLDDVFAFFKNPTNLETLTPSWIGFHILESTDREVRTGTRIRYRLRLFGVPVRWESRITEYVENGHFADEQTVGPYRRWHHRHVFHAAPDGVWVDDIVDYEMPLGPLGRLVHAIAVRRQLKTIFDYRARQMALRFPKRPAVAGEAVHA
jgi:hypothetical protein